MYMPCKQMQVFEGSVPLQFFLCLSCVIISFETLPHASVHQQPLAHAYSVLPIVFETNIMQTDVMCTMWERKCHMA